MLLRRGAVDRRSLLSLCRRLLTDFPEVSQEVTPNAETRDAFYEQEATESLFRSFSPPPLPEPAASPVIEKPKVVIPVEVKMPDIEGESLVDRIIRSHNSSLYGLQGQVIVGRVVSVGQRSVLVDLGWKDFQTFMKSELTLSQIYRRTSDEKRKEGDFRAGDELRFRIEEVGTPHGDIFVSTERMRADIRLRSVWNELMDAWRDKRRISGRVLNPCNAGYAVGVAGFVAFCPLNRMSPNKARKIGVLEDFLVNHMGERVGHNLVIVDPKVQYGATRGPSGRPLPRPSFGRFDRGFGGY